MEKEKHLSFNAVVGKAGIVLCTIALAALCIAIPDLWFNYEPIRTGEGGGGNTDLFWTTAMICVVCLWIYLPSGDQIRRARKKGSGAMTRAVAWWLVQSTAIVAITILSVNIVLSLESHPSALGVFLTLLIGTMTATGTAAAWWWNPKAQGERQTVVRPSWNAAPLTPIAQ